MELSLTFAEERISGQGEDPIGEFTISGAYDKSLANCSWSKQYVGQHCVEYTGRACERGIVGSWRIAGQPAFWSGPFFIWLRDFGNLESAFEKAFLEYELTPPFAGSPV